MNIVRSPRDSERFLQSLLEFNTKKPIGSLYEHSLVKDKPPNDPLVKIICFCLNPNHFHIIVQQSVDGGISKLFHRLGGGFTKYMNIKHKRRGVLFNGPFKAKHIDNNDYLLHASVYVNLNNRVHQLGPSASKLVRSSWSEYTSGIFQLCSSEVVLEQFKSLAEYEKYALDGLTSMIEKRPEYEELKHLEP